MRHLSEYTVHALSFSLPCHAESCTLFCKDEGGTVAQAARATVESAIKSTAAKRNAFIKTISGCAIGSDPYVASSSAVGAFDFHKASAKVVTIESIVYLNAGFSSKLKVAVLEISLFEQNIQLREYFKAWLIHLGRKFFRRYGSVNITSKDFFVAHCS